MLAGMHEGSYACKATTQLPRCPMTAGGIVMVCVCVCFLVVFFPLVVFPDSSQNTEASSMVLQDNIV